MHKPNTAANIVSINIKINVYLKLYNTLIFSVLKIFSFGEDLGGATYKQPLAKKIKKPKSYPSVSALLRGYFLQKPT
jgi:hypothetical protein